MVAVFATLLRKRPPPSPAVSRLPVMAELLRFARDPFDATTRALAAALAQFHCIEHRLTPLWGMSPCEFAELVEHYLPGLQASFPAAQAGAEAPSARRIDADEFIDLLVLLDEHRVDRTPPSAWLVRIVALCCMGENHLWEDMGLANRGELSALMAAGFPALCARNRDNMRWKKFLYKQLCEREELFLCRSPICTECGDYKNCFGPETSDQSAWTRRSD